MLGSKFKNGANSDNDVVEVGVIEGFTLPLVLFALYFPKLTSQLGHAILPAAADAHALIKLDTDVRVRRLPDVVFFKFALNAPANHLCGHPEQVLHAALWVRWEHVWVPPNLIKGVLNRVN